jgi:hypothetical protein
VAQCGHKCITKKYKKTQVEKYQFVAEEARKNRIGMFKVVENFSKIWQY